MPTTTRDRTDELRALEELWAAPALGEARPERRRLPLLPGSLLVGAWFLALLLVYTFQPAAEAGMITPQWGVALQLSLYFTLLAAAAIGPTVPQGGFALAFAGGVLGLVIAVACRSTAHHLGNWWLAELAGAAILTGLAAAGLVQRLRR